MNKPIFQAQLCINTGGKGENVRNNRNFEDLKMGNNLTMMMMIPY